jgi:site-specific DNA-methyltransferase (cytosine-N4-specific)
MKFAITCRIKPYIQPFERKLALRELEILAGALPKPVPSLDDEPQCFRVSSQIAPAILARELAFWEAVCGERTITTAQSLREATVNVVRNGVPLDELAGKLPFKNDIPLPNRRCLRYATHGLHEYRGKFFPQLVRALINVADVSRGGVVADPFCGSGTTAVEALLAKRQAIALDMNPLSVFMARAKCNVLRLRFEELEKDYSEVRAAILNPHKRKNSMSWISSLPEEDREYLKNWFADAILMDLDQIASCIAERTNEAVRDFMFLCLSNILRRVSWQKEDDLRVRRELKPVDEIDPIKEFLEELGRSTRLVLAFLRQEGQPMIGSAEILEGDSKALPHHWKKWSGKIDVAITSPPYATALPYLDTDRLSLCFLRLLTRSDHRDRDHDMIGNREITDKERRTFWEQFRSGKHELPDSVTNLISQIHGLNENTDAGFRRRNLPSLLFKYFNDMRRVFAGLRQVLKPGASAFVVVGNNHTIAGGQRVDIATVDLLSHVAEAVGFKFIENMEMEMLVSRDIFKNNAIESESILHFRRNS